MECSGRCGSAVRVGRVIGESVTRWSSAGRTTVRASHDVAARYQPTRYVRIMCVPRIGKDPLSRYRHVSRKPSFRMFDHSPY